MTTKTESRKLNCLLSEDELLQRGNELAKTYIEIAALDLQKKRITSQIKPLDERIEALVVIIDTKEEERSVACEWQPNFAEGIKRLRRLDTYEVIDTREIRDFERQQQFELETSPKVDEGLALGAEEPQPDLENTCYNTGCLQYEEGEGNHCKSLEYTEECDNPQGTGAPQEEGNARPETETAEEGSETGDEVAGSAAGAGADEQVNLCAVCVGACGDFTPGTAVSECPGFDCELNEEQVNHRDTICTDEWRDCPQALKCFGPANEEGPDTECLMMLAEFKEPQPVKEFACKICGFDGTSKVYLSRHVEREHNLTMSQYKKQFPANQSALQIAREKRARLIKGAK